MGMVAAGGSDGEVRRAGFEPISRPVQRGRVYVLFALDPYDIEVRLAVDAGSGRVLRVTGIPRYGGGGEYVDRPHLRSPAPPPTPRPNTNTRTARDNTPTSVCNA